jgi:hypothetical protein
MTSTLCERLGGVERLAAIVEDSIDRLAADPVLAHRFRGQDLPRLKELGVRFLCATSEELVAATGDVIAALEEHGVRSAEINEMVSILQSLKGVTK